MEKEITENLVFLTKNLSNLTIVLVYLEQCYIISKEESDEIKAEKTPIDKNYKLLSTLQKKNWPQIRNLFLDILHKTNNEYCAQEIERRNFDQSILQKLPLLRRNIIFHPKINKKWWPEKKLLIKSLLKRKFGDKLVVDELHSRMSRDENRMLIICESPAASKYSGMGGVGKTLTAKWYAHTYEQEYDHIIWIDCGEGSLLTSFKSLAGDLKIEDRNELVKIQDYSRKCFDSLRGFKCLWVFDNAENYKGVDGIKNVLPKDEKNFYCIITSRSREWGTEAGFGKISDLELDIFSEEESLEFCKHNLNSSIKHTESQIKELCRLMGNLPLALQLSVAALNGGKIGLKSYLEKNKFEKVIDCEFDDYERTINKNVKIALELILKENSGKEANEILLIFGYIRPDDVEVEFFMKVLNCDNKEKLKGAIKVLKKYSLVGKTKMQIKDKIKISLSVHRLLQQVIRHNGRETEKETLRKILSCEGFIDYKLNPFTKYADEELRKEFPKVKAELLDQWQLCIFCRLIWEKIHEESVQLAKFIHGELKTKATKFNYAVCLHKNGQKEECLDLLKELNLETRIDPIKEEIASTLEKMLKYLKTVGEIGIHVKIDLKLIDLKSEPTKKEIGDPLFYHYLGSGRIKEASTIGQKMANETHLIEILGEVLRQRRFDVSVQLAEIIAEQLKTKTAKFNVAICLEKNGQFNESLDILKKLDQTELMETSEYSNYTEKLGMLGLEEELSKDRIWGHLLIIYWKMDNRRSIKELLEIRQRFDLIPSTGTLDTLIRLIHSNLINSNYSLVKGMYESTIKLELGVESSKIDLYECSLDLSSFDRLSPEELELKYVSFNRNGREVEEANANEFCDFHKINKLTLNCDKTSIELNDEISMEYLNLKGVKVLNWNGARWNIQRLVLENIPFVEKTKMKIKEMDFWRSSLDISCLPTTIEKLYLWEADVVCDEPIDFPNLKYLLLWKMSNNSLLSSFRSPNLTHIQFLEMKLVNVDQLPKNVTYLKIANEEDPSTIVVSEIRRMDKLILGGFDFKKLDELLVYFQTDELVIDFHSFTPKELIELTKKEIKRMAIGHIEWDKEDDDEFEEDDEEDEDGEDDEEEVFSVLSCHVDREADYYLWEGGRGRGMDWGEFWDFKKL